MVVCCLLELLSTSVSLGVADGGEGFSCGGCGEGVVRVTRCCLGGRVTQELLGVAETCRDCR